MKRMGGLIMKLSLATTGLATMCCLTTACGKEADLTPIDTSAVPNTTSSIVTTAPITTTTPIVTSTQQMSVDIPLTDDIIIDTTIGEDIVIVTDENVSRDTFTTSNNLTEPTKTTTVGTTTTKKPTTVTTTKTTTTKKPTVTTTTTKKKTTTTTTTTAKKQEITTTTSPVIKITQSDVDKLVNELQEYSNSKCDFDNLFYTEEEMWERIARKTPSNSSWNSPEYWNEYQNPQYISYALYDDKLTQLKEVIDAEYVWSPNCHIVVYAEYVTKTNGYTGWDIYLLR